MIVRRKLLIAAAALPFAAFAQRPDKVARVGWLPRQFTLSVNLRTAKALGIAIPQAILLRADELIE